MQRHALILSTTHDFLLKFEKENALRLMRMGYTVHFAANEKEPAYLSDLEAIKRLGIIFHPIPIARSPFLFQQNFRALKEIVHLLRSIPISILHCHTPVGGVLGRLAGALSKRYPLTVIYTAHGFHFYRGAPFVNHLLYAPIERILAHLTDLLVVINDEDDKAARSFHLRKGGRVYKIPGIGLDPVRFSPLSDTTCSMIRNRLSVSPDEFLLIAVGELNHNKNHTAILSALHAMKQAGTLHNVKLIICGDGFLKGHLAHTIRSLGLSDIVSLYGHRTDVPALIGCADALVFPSVREGLGMAAIEALAMGIPVIAADNRGSREYLLHKQNGFLCCHDDPHTIKEGILFLQNRTPQQKKEMNVRCIESARPFEQQYTAAVMHKVYGEADRRINAACECSAVHKKSKPRPPA